MQKGYISLQMNAAESIKIPFMMLVFSIDHGTDTMMNWYGEQHGYTKPREM